MATGIGSWFGGGIKQLEPVDENGHIIMDYSIHDAIEAGFNKVVFIIRKDIEEEFKEVIGDRIESICSKHQVTVDYAFQDINEIPGELPEGRTKPWGTGQAVLAAKDMLTTPFIVINADDYYGKEGFRAVHEYLVRGGEFCMAGFVLKNTLSDNGGVTRGICKMDDQNNLKMCIRDSLRTGMPHNTSLLNRVFNKLSKGTWFERRITKDQKLALCNYLECEAHRELFLQGLKESLCELPKKSPLNKF